MTTTPPTKTNDFFVVNLFKLFSSSLSSFVLDSVVVVSLLLQIDRLF